MHRFLFTLALLSLPLLLLLSVAVSLYDSGSVQSAGCSGQNRCEAV